jgi:hypothetical protein
MGGTGSVGRSQAAPRFEEATSLAWLIVGKGMSADVTLIHQLEPRPLRPVFVTLAARPWWPGCCYSYHGKHAPAKNKKYRRRSSAKAATFKSERLARP